MSRIEIYQTVCFHVLEQLARMQVDSFKTQGAHIRALQTKTNTNAYPTPHALTCPEGQIRNAT